ncbi:MAG TPA: magnesium/cobalt transporter CorA [Pyrinomonadaceae bacterium]|jgi:magnesium transporter|nr:magnesium/cobalt transporter CorA [Pyrinomonadaceae bacterium]
MEIIVYREGAEKIETGFTVEQLPELLKDEKTVIWVDMDKPTEADDQILLNVFRFHPLTVEDCRETRNYPKVEEFPGYLYFILHGVQADTSPDHFNTIELDAFIGSNYVITYHHDEFRSINNVKKLLSTSPVLCQRGAAFLIHQIFDQIVDYYSPVLDDFDERIAKLEDDIFTMSRPNKAILEEIMDLKRGVLRLRRITGRQREVILRASRGEFSLIPAQLLPFYRDIYDHIMRVTDMAESYRDLLSGALDAYMSVVGNRMNEIMKVLTVFSAVMLPLTFIAGVYGMNFDYIPELHKEYGYFVVWGVMLTVAVVMLTIFWRAGWIGSSRKTKEPR